MNNTDESGENKVKKSLLFIILSLCPSIIMPISMAQQPYASMAKNIICHRVHVRNATKQNAIIATHILKPGDEAVVFEQCLNEYDRMGEFFDDTNLAPIIIEAAIRAKVYQIVRLNRILSRDVSFTLKEDDAGTISVEALSHSL